MDSTLLVVDDRPDNVFAIVHLLRESLPQCVVLTADCAEKGLSLAAECSVDGVIVDVHMPGINGVEMCAMLKADAATAHLPVMLVTSHDASAELKAQGLLAGADDFITRPIDNAELVARTKVLLRTKRVEDELRDLNAHLEQLVEGRAEALREGERKYRELVQSANSIIMRRDTDGRLTFINQYALEFFGYTEEEIIGRNVVGTIVPPTDSLGQDLGAMIRSIGEQPELYAANQNENMRRNGERVWIAWTNRAIRDEQGRTVEILSVGNDITERKRAEEALRESEERFRMTFEQAPIGAALLDPDGRFLRVNAELCRITGYSPAELVSRSVLDITDPEHRSRTEGLMADLLAGRVDHGRTEERYVRSDGEAVWGRASMGMLRDAMGRPGSLMLMIEDISGTVRAVEALRRSEEQLRALAARLQEAREEERKLMARRFHDDLAHSFAALKMDLAWVTRRLESSAQEWPDDVAERVRAMMNMLDEGVRFARDAATELRPGVLDDFGLAAAIEWLTDRFSSRSGIPCRLNCVRSDFGLSPEQATAIFRICQELLTNVWQHAEAGETQVTLEARDGGLLLEVSDNGKGISQDEISAPASLGILGVRERALLLGGTVEISGVPGRGTTIGVHVPLPRDT